jgi:RNA polymerase sigma factor (sigma-70 family)
VFHLDWRSKTARLLTPSVDTGKVPEDPRVRFEGLVRQYGRLIASVVRRVAHRAGDLIREDIEQKVLVALWRQIESEQTIEYPSSYIYRIAVREAVRMMRQEISRAQEPLEESGPGAVQPASSPSSPYDDVARREIREHIERSLDELTPERARAVRAHLAGFAVQEIMEMYGWPYQKARNLIARGMADLREGLDRRGIHG